MNLVHFVEKKFVNGFFVQLQATRHLWDLSAVPLHTS